MRTRGLLLGGLLASCSSLPVGRVEGFLDLEQIADVLRTLARGSGSREPGHGPFTFGHSLEGRPMSAVCLGACKNENADQVLLTALHHAREPLGMMLSLRFGESLLEEAAAGSLEAVTLLRRRQIWIQPVTNPDGYHFNIQSENFNNRRRLARKNRRSGCSSGSYDQVGVDLNRNFDFAWDLDNQGSSPITCAEDYRGESAFSEPESQALRDFILAHNFSTALNFHSYGRLINLPYAVTGVDDGHPPAERYALLLALAQRYSRSVVGTAPYAYGHPWENDLHYTANGDGSDWMNAKAGVLAVSPELGPAFNDPFEQGMWPAKQLIPQLLQEALGMPREAAWAAGGLPQLVTEGVQVQLTEDCGTDCVSVRLSKLVAQNAGVRATTGAVTVSAVLLTESPSDTLFCGVEGAGTANAEGACAAPWIRLGLAESLCGTGQAGASMDSAECLTSSLPPLPADAVPSVSRRRLHKPYHALAERVRQANLQWVAEARAGAPRLRGDGSRNHTRLQRLVEGLAPRYLTTGGQAVSSSSGGDALRELQEVTSMTSAGVTVAVATLPALEALQQTEPMSLQLQARLSGATGSTALQRCQAAAAARVTQQCIALGGGAPTAPADDSPFLYVSVSDDLLSSGYLVSCAGRVTPVARRQTGCLPASLLRSQRWTAALSPGQPSTAPASPSVPASSASAPASSPSAPASSPSAPAPVVSPPSSPSHAAAATPSSSPAAALADGTDTMLAISWPWVDPANVAPGWQLTLFFSAAFAITAVVYQFLTRLTVSRVQVGNMMLDRRRQWDGV